MGCIIHLYTQVVDAHPSVMQTSHTQATSSSTLPCTRRHTQTLSFSWPSTASASTRRSLREGTRVVSGCSRQAPQETLKWVNTVSGEMSWGSQPGLHCHSRTAQVSYGPCATSVSLVWIILRIPVYHLVTWDKMCCLIEQTKTCGSKNDDY